MDPKVSIIIPVYNGGDYLKIAIQSVLSQIYTNYELIIIDDNSTDNSVDVVSRFVNNGHSEIIFLGNTKNEGVAKSRNKGLKYASGDYVAFLDSDDAWYNGKLKEQVDFALKNNAFMIHTDVDTYADRDTIRWIESNTNFNYPDYWDRFWNSTFPNKKSYFELLSYGCPICWSSVMVSKKVIDDFGLTFDEDLIYQNEDWVFLLKLSRLVKFYYLSKRLTVYRLHKDSYSVKNLLSGNNWDADTAIGQAHDRYISFSSEGKRVVSYNAFKPTTLKSKVKQRIKKGRKLLKYCVSKAKDVYRSNRRLKPIGDIDLLILFVTDACNLSCGHCFYRDSINSGNKFLYVDLLKILRSVKINNLLFTGGEPFLDSAISAFISTSLRYCNTWVNTNGYNTKFIIESVENALICNINENFGYDLTVSVSIDGFEKTHNTIRSNSKAYSRALDTLRLLLLLRKKYNNLKVMITTTITPSNIKHLHNFAKEMALGFDVDYHNFEVQRPKELWKNIGSFRNDLLFLYRNLLSVIEWNYPDYYLLNKKRFGIQYENLANDNKWGFPCIAGSRVFTVYPNADITACEMRDPILNLKDFNIDMKRVINSNFMKIEQLKIKDAGCDCTHGCWLITSMQGDNK